MRHTWLSFVLAALLWASAAAWGIKEYPYGTFMSIPASPVDELMGGTRTLSAWPDHTQEDIMTSYRYLVCGNTDVYVAKTTQQMADIVAGLKDTGRTIRAISHRLPHSPASFPCASLNTGDPRQVTILVDMPDVITPLDPATGLVTIGASMDLFTLAAQVFEAANRTLPNMAWPYHAWLTAGGVFSAGSHGSNMLPGGHFMDMVTCVKYVDASATIRTACQNRDPDMFRALKAGLGMLGIITELTVQSVENTKTQVQILYYEDDSNITQAIEAVKRDPTVDNLFVVWRPDVKRMALILGRTLPYNTPMYPVGGPYPPMPDGAPTGPFSVVTSGLTVQNYTDLVGALMAWNSPGGLCYKGNLPVPVNDYLAELSKYLVAFTWASYVKADGTTVRLDPIETPLGRDMVGRTNLLSMSFPCQMQSTSGTLCFYADSPGGVPNLSFKDVEIAIPDTPDNLRSVVADVRRLVAMDLQSSVTEYLGANPNLTPHMSVGAGVMFRFSSKSDTILGMNGQGKVIWVGMESFNYLESPNLPFPGRNYYMADVMEQHLVCKYKGRVHWGKNIDRAFLNPNCPLRDNLAKDIKQFSKFQDLADPDKIFEPPLYKKIKAGSAPTYSPGCDVTRKCICTEDSHCVLGWNCVASLAFPQYKVCKPPPGWDCKTCNTCK